MQGAPLATINAVSPVWLVASLPQADAGIARSGARVTARTSAYPGETFSGRIESVLPAADPATRTVEVRIALANQGGRLRPGMTADVEIAEPETRAALIVPAEAVIQTGRRSIVIVAGGNGRFTPVQVELGRRAGDRIEVRRGVEQGQRIVASGQFLIDSEASLTGALERLEAAQAAQSDGAATHEASGRITALSGANVSIAHGAIPTLNWPAMTMQFTLENEHLAHGLAVGDEVSFRIRQEGSRYIVTAISKVGSRP
jgi:Cu(I)/Ag(I) efflux system membrane fusion protein